MSFGNIRSLVTKTIFFQYFVSKFRNLCEKALVILFLLLNYKKVCLSLKECDVLFLNFMGDT